MSEYHDQYTDILGAYALDAVEPDEQNQIELHLRTCPRCRAEVAEHREVASYLSQSGASAPEGVWDRIAAELSPPAPPLRLTFSRDDEPAPAAPVAAPVVPIGSGRSASRKVRTRTMVAVVSVAACIVAALGVVAVGQTQRLNRVETALEDRSVEDLAHDAMASSELNVKLKGDAGTAEAVVGGNGQGYLIMNEFPAPADGDVYQLWGKVDGTILSLGTFGGDTRVVPFSVDPDRVDDIELFAVTQEKAPGVVSSKNDAVIAGTA